MNKKIELLSPAGDMECLKTAFLYGADAVYVGGPFMQLRAASARFESDILAQAVEYAHSLSKKIYVTVNSFAKNNEIEPLKEYAKFLCEIGADAAIVSDIGALSAIKESAPDLGVHISTQANCTNYNAVKVYSDMGASRVVLARELTLEEIAEIAVKKPEDIQLEAFIHGAMCMSYSGRCLISSYLTSRSGNRGECTQPCRWSYYLVEKNRPNEFFELIQESGASAILSSHDMCCIEILDDIVSSGVESLKIEGRMKTPYYVAAVTNAYRNALDKTYDIQILKDELDKISHRPYSTGFYYNKVKTDTFNDGNYIQKAKFAAVVLENSDGYITVQQRNNFKIGDTLEVISPNLFGLSFSVEEIIDEKGNSQENAPHPMQILKLKCPLKLKEGDILRLPVTKNGGIKDDLYEN